ncbi:MAG: hypothetical protein AAF600_18350 [Bacteroidota bacterium]
MKKITLQLVIFLCFSPTYFGFAQSEKSTANPQSSLVTYHNLPRESIHLHLNKTTYVIGEEIWFSGYVFDRVSQKPFEKTTNVYVGIYDTLGKQLHKRLLLAQDGHLKGNIFIDSTYTYGDYYLKASTNWMRNFKEDDSQVLKIKVLDAASEVVAETSSSGDYDVQFLPEGGNLISGITNNVGVKVLNDKGYGISLEQIRIVDDLGRFITRIQVSKLGMGRFEFVPEQGRNYSAEVELGNSFSRYILPRAEKKGINVRVYNNSYHDKVGIVFRTNEETGKSLGNRKFYFLIHKDGLSEKMQVDFDSSGEAKFFLKRSDLKKGVNVITLFDEANMPILERMFFNRDDLQLHTATIDAHQFTKDSISIKVSGGIPNAQLSVSVLPQGTVAYNPIDNIASTFYLKPYLSGFVENPGYYFTNISEKKDYELDALMLTQGWSRYKWEDVFNNPPDKKYDFEDGVVLNVTLNGLDEKFKGKLMLHKTEHHSEQLLDADSDKNRFLVTSFFPVKGEQIHLSVVDKKGKLSEANAYLRFLDEWRTDQQTLRWPDNSIPTNRFVESEVDNLEIKQLITDRTIFLEEVEVAEEKEEVPNNNPFIPVFIQNKTQKVDLETVQRFPLFTTLLSAQYGYFIIENAPAGRVFIQSSRRGGLNLVIDGVRHPNADLLYRLPTQQVEEFWVDRLSRYEGASGQGNETIYVYTRVGNNLEGAFRKTASVHEVKKGFENPKEFYMPKYSTFQNKAFEQLGTIHWIPDLKLDAYGKGEFSIFNTETNNISFFIEGMSPLGKLSVFSKTLLVNSIP